ncbi:hypothetical protein [Aquabacterium sp.]
MGFAAVPSFHRAFWRWKGVTPLQWQEQQLARSGTELARHL